MKVLGLVAVAVAIEVVAAKHWIDSAGFDCYPHCDTGQTVSGWVAALLPVALLVVIAVLLARRWARSR
ncbi:MAG: hypothetical protein JW895_15935 [Thermoleophilaceae bacterium]|nr:hypothetical protein [Thermoleophilaceae bacterium]